MKIIIFFLLLLTALPLFSTTWTIFVYMAVDNGLHRYGIEDIIEMQRGLSQSIAKDKPRIIVYIDHYVSGVYNYKNGIVEYLEITPSNENTVVSRVLRSYPDENSGSGDTLLKFLNWAYPKYASKHNMLVITSHGEGWMRGISRWIGEDSSPYDRIGVSTGELHNALKRHNKKYDIFLLDACHAGSIEVISEVKDFTDYVIASPDLFPSTGYPWTQIISSWNSNNEVKVLAENICDELINAYTVGGIYNEWGYVPMSVSLTGMAYYDELIKSFKDFADTFSTHKYSSYFLQVKDKFPKYNNEADIDLHLFVDEIYNNFNITDNNKNIIDNLYKATNNFIIKKDNLNNKFPSQSISIWFPDEADVFNYIYKTYWHNLIFAQSNWAKFLNYVYGWDIYPPDPVSEVNFNVNLETIYIKWTPPIDPTELTYEININGDVFTTSDVYFSSKINKSGKFSIIAIDEAKNRSDWVEHDFMLPIINENHFYIAPNPVTAYYDKFTVFYYLTNQSKFIEVSIYDISGKSIWKEKFYDKNSGEHSFQVKKFTSGIYFAVLKTDNNILRYKFSISN